MHEMDNPNIGPLGRRVDGVVRVLDDHVDATYGVTRADDPQRYAAIVGPSSPGSANRPNLTLPALTRRCLVELVGRIEQL